jgi:uncharacterized membrane protein YozB (DUF420 family)
VIALLVHLLILVLVVGLVYYILTQLPIPAPMRNVVLAIFGVICAIVIVYALLPLVTGLR